jgi:glycosyltransferase involved in cell wall biosynthesis
MNAKVVIGMPVFNGENFVAEAVASILGQSMGDWRLVIADNASTDGTEEICRAFAQRDRRVEYHRHASNIGAAPNYNFVFRPGDASYFKWAAHDDTLGPTFLERCAARLDEDASLAMCHCRTATINEHGERIGTYDNELRLAGARARDRLRHVLWAGYFNEVFGVFRAECVARTRLHGSFVGSDRNFMAELVLQGDVGYVEEYLFERRDHPGCYVRAVRSEEERLRWFDTSKGVAPRLAGLTKFRHYVSSVLRLGLSRGERLACLRELLNWAGHRGLEVATGAGQRYRSRLVAEQNVRGQLEGG